MVYPCMCNLSPLGLKKKILVMELATWNLILREVYTGIKVHIKKKSDDREVSKS